VVKRLLLLAAEFLVITVPLGYLWSEGIRRSYLEFFVKLTTPVLMFIGVRDLYGEYFLDHCINYVPFLVLMVITPTLSWKRRVIGSFIGFAIIFVGHIGLASVAYYAIHNYGQTQKAFSVLFPGYLINDSLPFIIWAIIASSWLKQVVGTIRKRKGSSTE
jgi:hypothetical protein